MQTFAYFSIAAFALSKNPVYAEGSGSEPVEKPDSKFLWQTYEMLELIAPETNDPSTWAIESRKMLLKYGCYCFPEAFDVSKPRNGYSGPGLDELDEACRDLYRAQKCILDDLREEGITGCSLDNQYEWHQDNTGAIVCGPDGPGSGTWNQQPENQCMYRTCELERQFVYRVKALVNNGSYQQRTDIYELQDSDYDSFCPAPTHNGGGDHTTECCGTGLSRKHFNSVVNQCCAEQVESFGTC